MSKRIITHPDLPPPYGAYSTVVAAGGFLFISGLAGIDPATGERAGDDFEAEARQAFENLRLCLACSGAEPSDVVRCTTYLADLDGRATLNALFAEFFPLDPPARSAPIVQLPMGLRLSLEATAIDPT